MLFCRNPRWGTAQYALAIVHRCSSSCGRRIWPKILLEKGMKFSTNLTFHSLMKLLKAFELMKKQEETRQAEVAARAAEFKAMQAQAETERQRVIYDEQKKLTQHQAQTKSQMARYEDELARKRMQAENEYQ
ncbi:ATPase family AAA domain-containing protein 3A homolog [Gossypium hirsutum]|uniref:ATPase family AAA domain-containing protein 3A homolog n=1 Tax=Gossypium hirsutum TaxID=3635 RepID=A0ABM2ZFC3_GOSHI|nr:ATPase family AAA domain-containing protein 3A homolog [Gossypium hirsutum]